MNILYLEKNLRNSCCYYSDIIKFLQKKIILQLHLNELVY